MGRGLQDVQDMTVSASGEGTLEKVELHCHLDGIVNREILSSRGPESSVPVDLLDGIGPVRDIASFVGWFARVDPHFRGRLDRFHFVLQHHIRQLARDRVCYAEVMIAKSAVATDLGVLDAQFAALQEVANAARSTGVALHFLIALGRNKAPDVIDEQAKRVIWLFERGYVCGVALAGLPEAPVRPFARTFDRLSEAGMGIEIHAGELGGSESVWDALTYGHPHRLGHGLAVFDDPGLIDHVREHAIHIEFCPTSNRALTGRGDFVFSAIRVAIERGIGFSINTDDPGPFGCTVGSEHDLVRAHLGLSDADFTTIRDRSLAARFGDR